MSDLSSGIAELSTNFSGRLLQSKDPDWNVARRVHNGLIDKRPAIVAQCRGTADIAHAVRLARDHGLEIAVRGGGHNVGGRATCDGGMMIDLSLMKYVHVDPVKRTARAAGGTLWGQFNRETQLHGLATTGGVVSTTGVAGLTLGGGLGWLMPKHGMSLDNLQSVEMVLADGRIVRAAADENVDLFWAVRGGGGNFGVASSFEFKLHPIGPVVQGGLIAWPAERARDVLRHFRDLTADANDDVMLVAALLTAPDGVTRLAAIGAGYFGGTATEGEKILERVRSLGPPAMDALGAIPYTQLNAMLDAAYPAGARNYWKSHFCDDLSDAALDTIVEGFARVPSPLSHFVIESFHGAVTRVAPTETAYALRANGFNVLALGQWMGADGDAAARAWVRDVYAALQRFLGNKRYVNYLDQDDVGDQVLVAAYGPNVRRLQSIKATYDPENLFRLNVNIPPKA